jgi:hypothetical protein
MSRSNAKADPLRRVEPLVRLENSECPLLLLYTLGFAFSWSEVHWQHDRFASAVIKQPRVT